jgi:DNA-binding transcriptional MocR family regulator
MCSKDIRDVMSTAHRSDMISFTGGMPDNRLLPIAEIDHIYHQLSRDAKERGMQYGPTGGYPPLVKALRRYLHSKGLPVEQNTLLITTGSMQAIYLIAKIFLDPGDGVILENPTFMGAISAFKSFQAALLDVPMDEEGVVPDGLAIAAARQPLCKFAYVIPNFHNPYPYSRARKEEILNILHERKLVLVEDDPYNELYFDDTEQNRIIPMVAMNKTDLPICYTGSFSKILGPGMRVGWMLGPEEIIRHAESVKQSIDACTPMFTQVLAHEFLISSVFENYLAGIRLAYKKRCHGMLTALDRYMPAEVRYNRPIGGFYIWLTLPAGVDATTVLKRALPRGVEFVVGKTFDPQGVKNDHLRLAFCHTAEENIEPGIRILAEVIEECMG